MNKVWVVIALIVAIAATGCAHVLTQPMPKLKGQLGLKVSEEKASEWTDMPAGVHRIPETSVYVYGPEQVVSAPFGMIGLLGAHVAAQLTAEKDPAALRIAIAAEADRVLKEELERRRDLVRFALPGGRADATLEVIPYIVLTFVGEERVRPWVVLKVLLKDTSGDEKWKTRYSASLDDPRLLAGENGWTSAGGEPLRKAIDRALRAGIGIMLRDAAGQLPRGKGRMAKVKGNWVWEMRPLEITAEILEETPDMLVVKPDVPDAMVLAGISILDPRRVSVTANEENK